MTVPLAAARLPPAGRLRALISQLVQLRPILEDPARAVYLEQPGQTPQLITYPAPEPDPERPVLFDSEVQVAPSVTARIVVRRAKEPLSQGFSRATRRGGLVIRSGRAAHETTLAGFEGRPGSRHLYGEVFCEAIEQLQRDALERPRPELVVKVDRSGLNEHHPIVERLYRGDRPGAQADRRRRGAPRRRAPDRRPASGHRPRSGRAARAQRPAQGRVRSARHSGRRARREPGGQAARATGRGASPSAEPSDCGRAACRQHRGRAGAGAVVQAVAGAAASRREAHGHAARRPDPGDPRHRRSRSRPTRA